MHRRGERRRVYASLPLTGPAGALGRELLRGAELALERPERAGLELVVLDASDADRDVRAEAHAHRAADDPAASAYLGELHSPQVLRSAPVLSAAGLLQVAPVATFTGLRGDTLVTLSPDDGAGARAIADWLVRAGVRTLVVAHDHDDGYGVPVGTLCAEAARARGIEARPRPLWEDVASIAGDVEGAQAVLYVGVAGSGAVELWHALHAADPRMWLLGTDGVAVPWLASALGTTAAERTRFFGAQRAPWGFYGYEAMALILDATAARSGDRAGAVRTARATRDRDSVLGRYSIDERGRTTSAAYGCFAVAGGELVWDRSPRIDELPRSRPS